MSRFSMKGQKFKTHPYCRYATDVTLQHTNRLSRVMEESKAYNSAKYKLYGSKAEVPVLPTGLAVNCVRHYSGSRSDIDIYSDNDTWHKMAIKKKWDEIGMSDT